MEIPLKLSSKQIALLKSEAELNVFGAGFASGKTAITSIIAILNLVKGQNVLIVAPIYGQLERNNFAQIKKFILAMNLDGIFRVTNLSVEYNNKKIYFLSGEAPERILGLTEIGVAIFDEVEDLSLECYNNTYSRMRDLKGFKRKIYIVGTPPASEDHWLVEKLKRDDVFVLNASALDNPFIEPDFVQDMMKDYEIMPENWIKRNVNGEFAFGSGSEQSVFNEFEIVENSLSFPNELRVMGVDLAGRGSDYTCLIVKQGKQVLYIEMADTPKDTDIRDLIELRAREYNVDVIRYDVSGISFDLTFDLDPKVKVMPVNFGGSGGERFANARSLMYARLAKEKTIFLKPNDYNLHYKSLMAELKATRYKLETENKKLALVKKDLIKEKIGGRSPDRADALALAFSYVPEAAHVSDNNPRYAIRRGAQLMS